MLHETGREPRRGSIHDLLKAETTMRGVSPSFVSASHGDAKCEQCHYGVDCTSARPARCPASFSPMVT